MSSEHPSVTVEQLTQEKTALQTQNAQLWRLVDKQRAMILGLQKDLERANRIIKNGTSSSRHELNESSQTDIGISLDETPTPTTPKTTHRISRISESERDSVEDYDDASSTIEPSPMSSGRPPSTPDNRNKKHTPRNLDLSTSRRAAISEEIPVKSPLRSNNSTRGIAPEETRERVVRNEGTYRPMSPALSLRMQNIDHVASPRIPSSGSHASSTGREEIERVNMPRRQRLRQLSQASVTTNTDSKNVVPPEAPSKDVVRSPRSLTPERAGRAEMNESAVYGNRHEMTDQQIMSLQTTRAQTPDEVISDARMIVPSSPCPEDVFPNSDSVGTLAEIAGPYYDRSRSYLPQSLDNDIHSRGNSSHVSVDTTRRHSTSSAGGLSPASVYEDDQSYTSQYETPAKTKSLVNHLEPAAEFSPTPEKVIWQEESPERLRSRGTSMTSTLGSHFGESAQDNAIARHTITPQMLGAINLRMTDSEPHGPITISVCREDKRLIHKVRKSYEALLHLQSTLATTVAINVPTREDFESTQPDVVSACASTMNLWLQTLQTNFQSQPPDFNSRLFCSFLSSDYFDDTANTYLSIAGDDINSFAQPRSTSLSPVGQTGPAHFLHPSETLPFREGYLSKRGKNFGGWKQRYFVLDGPVMRYYELPGGVLLDTIRLPQAQIGVHQQNTDNTSETDGLQHAFLILEPKKKSSSNFVRHVLCAKSDSDRDDWIRALLPYATMEMSSLPMDSKEAIKAEKRLAKEQKDSKKHPAKMSSIGSAMLSTPTRLKTRSSKPDDGEFLGAIGYNETTAGRLPLFESDELIGRERSGTLETKLAEPDVPTVSISGPMNGAPIDNNLAWGAISSSKAVPPTLTTSHSQTFANDKKAKKKSFWAFGKSAPADPNGSVSPRELASHRSASYNDLSFNSAIPTNGIFGQSLSEAVHLTTQQGLNVGVPSVIYRCIQYLDSKHVETEEGVYRLSGSNTVIRGLKDRFNAELDVDLVGSGEYFDVHAIAGLLKLYLRELPSSILTRDLQLDFLDIIDMPEGQARMITLRTLVQSLPQSNFQLLKILSGHLRIIVDNSEANKMTLRNVGIVFSPTLNIPAGVFSLFIAEYGAIFGGNEAVQASADTQSSRSLTSASSLDSMANAVGESGHHSDILLAQMYVNGTSEPAHVSSAEWGLQPSHAESALDRKKRANRQSGMVGIERYRLADNI